MSRRPIRVTGFTRFFLVMLLAAPLAYIGANYYNGKDGVAEFKQLLGINNSAEPVTKEKQDAETAVLRVNEAPASKAFELLEAENKKLKDELEFKNKRNEELYREIEELKRKLGSSEKALEESK